MRPGDANEVAESYRVAVSNTDHPVAMVLTRQNLPTLDRKQFNSATDTKKGGYVLADSDNKPEVILIGTGSELAICVVAYEKLAADGVKVRLVSMPCVELFDAQDQSYREGVLPPEITARVAVEAGIRQGWDRYIGSKGRFVGMYSFGASAPFQQLYERFGITAESVVAEAKSAIGS